MYLDIGACMRSPVEVVEIKPASNTGCPVLANRNRPVLRTAFINAAQTVHFAAFYFTSNLISSVRCHLRCNICLCSGELLFFILESKLERTDCTSMPTSPGLRLWQPGKNHDRSAPVMIALLKIWNQCERDATPSCRDTFGVGARNALVATCSSL
jgi:hypothetical protein